MHWIELDIRCGNGHLLVGGDRDAFVSLLEQFPCRTPTGVAKLCVSLSEVANEFRKSQMVRRCDDEMNVIRHQRDGVDRDSLFLAPLEEATEKEVLLARVREKTPAIVASQNDMVGVVRDYEEISR